MSNLRKRYKVNKCYDDIYIIAISIIEKKLHKDIAKTVVSSPPPNTGTHTIFTAAESAIITELHAIKTAMTEIRKENKELKQKLNVAITKIDNQEKIITKLQETTEKNNSEIPPPALATSADIIKAISKDKVNITNMH